MLTLVALWWLLFWTAFGLCIGSFLNVVIYRLPRNCSLRSPRWSACPNCRQRIEWYDNIPVLSFIRLRGRCRHCRAPIATRYVIIELMMAVIVLMLLDAFFISDARMGILQSPVGLNDELAADWPIFIAHIALFACLLAMSAVDLEHYWVDIRFTNIVTILGFALHALWTPKHSLEWARPLDTTAVVCLLAVAGLGLTWLVMICQPHADPEDFGAPPEGESPEAEQEAQAAFNAAPPPQQPVRRLAGWLLGAIAAILFVLLLLDESGQLNLKHAPRALLPLAFFFILLVAESTVARPADEAIVEAIHDERHEARRMVLLELSVLLPALLFGTVGFVLMKSGGELPSRIVQALHTDIRVPDVALFRNWSPLYGIATAASGYIIAGALGWVVRILFTLAFGKEAFGTGDIHLMAAAGCIAGWPVVVLAFFLTCLLALLGWVIALPFKRSRALPLGPWLSLGILAVVVFYDPLVRLPFIARAVDLVRWVVLEPPPDRPATPDMRGLR